MCKNRNKKFREKNNINIKYKMLKGGLPQLVAYGYIPLAQNFEADVTIKRANEYGYEIFFVLTLDRLRGEVSTLSWDPDSKEIETKENREFDIVALRIELAMGYKAVLRVETRDGDRAALQLLGVKEEENGKVKVDVKAIDEGANILQKKVLRKAKVDIALIEPFTDPSQDTLWERYLGQMIALTEARYDSREKTLIFANDLPPGQALLNWAAAGQPLSWAAAGQSLLLEIFRRSSSSGEGEVIKVVAKVQWMKADNEGLKVKLSNKEIKSVGKTARKATKALDGLKSGSYSVKVGPLADAFDIEGADAFDIEGGGFGAQIAGGIPVWSSIGLDVEDWAVLKKTKKVGLFELEFNTKRRARMLYINKDDKDTVRSKSLTSYLRGLAEKYDEDFPTFSNECGKWWECEPKMIVRMKTASGKEAIGELTDLKWKATKRMWVAKVGLGFADSERLGADDGYFKPLLVEAVFIWMVIRGYFRR
jgi:hypothetical protein